MRDGRHAPPLIGSVHYWTLLAKQTIRPEDARNSVRYIGFKQELLPSVAVQSTTLKFANRVIIGTQIYGKLRGRMSAATDVDQTGKKCSTGVPNSPLARSMSH